MILDIKFDEGVMWISDGRNGYTFKLTEKDLQSRIFHYINEIDIYKTKEREENEHIKAKKSKRRSSAYHYWRYM